MVIFFLGTPYNKQLTKDKFYAWSYVAKKGLHVS